MYTLVLILIDLDWFCYDWYFVYGCLIVLLLRLVLFYMFNLRVGCFVGVVYCWFWVVCTYFDVCCLNVLLVSLRCLLVTVVWFVCFAVAGFGLMIFCFCWIVWLLVNLVVRMYCWLFESDDLLYLVFMVATDFGLLWFFLYLFVFAVYVA